MKIFKILLLSLLAISSAWAAPYSPGATRIVDWTPNTAAGVGVTGGMKLTRTVSIDVTQSPYNANNAGTADVSNAVFNAIQACPNDGVVYFPPGTYRFDSRVYPQRGRYTIRGVEGLTRFTVPVGSSHQMILFGYNGYGFGYNSQTPTGTVTKGTTTLNLASTGGIVAGMLCYIGSDNDVTLPVAQTTSNGPARAQITQITAVRSNQVDISPGLYNNLTGLNPTFTTMQYANDQVGGIGCEDIIFDYTGTSSDPSVHLTNGVSFLHAYDSWLYRCKIMGQLYGFDIYVWQSLHLEVTKTVILGPGGSGSGNSGLLSENTCASLYYNNYLTRFFPHFEINYSSSGNVIAYNCLIDSTTGGEVGGSIDINHGPHNGYNLVEGNYAPNVQDDAYYGSSSECTIFRNWLAAYSTAANQARQPLLLNKMGRRHNVVGNLLGTSGYPYYNIFGGAPTGSPYLFGYPNIGSASFHGASSGNIWEDWQAGASRIVGTLTTRTGNTDGVVTLGASNYSLGSVAGNLGTTNIHLNWAGGEQNDVKIASATAGNTVITFTGGSGTVLPIAGTTMTFWPANYGFQEIDAEVAATMQLYVNHDVNLPGIPAGEALPGGTTLPNSLYLSAKPTWFGSLTYPAYDPVSPNRSISAIPAGYYYLNGVWPDEVVPSGVRPVGPGSRQLLISF